MADEIKRHNNKYYSFGQHIEEADVKSSTVGPHGHGGQWSVAAIRAHNWSKGRFSLSLSLSPSYTHNKYASALLFYVVENAYKERGRPQKAQTEGRAKRGEFQEYVELQVFKDCRGLWDEKFPLQF